MKTMASLVVLTIALGLAGCADTPPQAAASSGNAYAYPAVSATSGGGNAYNWLQGGG
jgi:hypothetical protein